MSRRRVVVIAILASIGVIALLQAQAASGLKVVLYDSKIVERNDSITTYDVALRFENPNIMLLAIGETNYNITVNGEKIGDGSINAFTLAPFESKILSSKFIADTKLVEKYKNSVEQSSSRLSGTSTFGIHPLALDVPFSHEPNPEQIKQFFNH